MWWFKFESNRAPLCPVVCHFSFSFIKKVKKTWQAVCESAHALLILFAQVRNWCCLAKHISACPCFRAESLRNLLIIKGAMLISSTTKLLPILSGLIYFRHLHSHRPPLLMFLLTTTWDVYDMFLWYWATVWEMGVPSNIRDHHHRP